MEYRSLVVVKKLFVVELWKPFIKWLPIDNEKEIYTIRVISNSINAPHVKVALLEEGVIGHDIEGHELAIPLERLREVQPPMEVDIANLMKILNPELAEV